MVIGICGLPGSGRSQLIKQIKNFASEKHIYIETNKLACYLHKKGGNCYNKLVETFGEKILNKDGEILYYRIQLLSGKDSSFYQEYHKTIQPYISAYLTNIIKKNPDKIIFFESPFLFDYDYHTKCHRIICVDSEYEVRFERLKEHRGLTKIKYENMLKVVKSREYFLEHSDFTIHTNSKTQLRKETKVMLRELRQLKEYVDKGLITL